jgi:tryptophan-rich sensory protein
MSAVSAWRATRDRGQRGWVIGLFALNGCLNVLWTTLFFTVKRPDWALVEVPLLWLSILAGILMFWRWSRTASYYLVPYLVWVSFAAFLNWTVVRLNAPFA